jgi:hypothetical protein
LIEEIVEEMVNELSSDNHLGECLTAYGGDMNLDTLLEQADAMLDSSTARETNIEGATKTSSSIVEWVKRVKAPTGHIEVQIFGS